MTNLIAEYWYVLIAFLCIGACIGAHIYKFFTEPQDEQISKVKQWLLWAVVRAESELGRDTGEVKLMYVYDLFISKFPTVAKFITFEHFHELVNNALEQMEDLLDESPNLLNYVQTKEPLFEKSDEGDE